MPSLSSIQRHYLEEDYNRATSMLKLCSARKDEAESIPDSPPSVEIGHSGSLAGWKLGAMWPYCKWFSGLAQGYLAYLAPCQPRASQWPTRFSNCQTVSTPMEYLRRWADQKYSQHEQCRPSLPCCLAESGVMLLFACRTRADSQPMCSIRRGPEDTAEFEEFTCKRERHGLDRVEAEEGSL
jgi:hypothetical protein